MQTTDMGDIGEQLASDELRRNGYTILERNWKTKWAEVDIVAKKDDVVYFVEVKYRSNNNQGDGFEYITEQKLTHMRRAAELWVNINNWNGSYELLGVSVTAKGKEIDVREIA